MTTESQKNRPYGWRFSGWLAALVILIVACVSCYLIALEYKVPDVWINLPRIQAALDRDCGAGVVRAKWESYFNDPAPSYSSQEASCFLFEDEFECTC